MGVWKPGRDFRARLVSPSIRSADLCPKSVPLVIWVRQGLEHSPIFALAGAAGCVPSIGGLEPMLEEGRSNHVGNDDSSTHRNHYRYDVRQERPASA